MNKLTIVIFIDWYLPAYKAGGPVKSVSSIVQQFKEEVDFHIITSDRDFGDQQAYTSVELNKWVRVQDANVIYLSPERQTAENFKKLTVEINPDKIYFNSLFSKNFTLTPLRILRRSFPNKEFIVAPRGMLGSGALKIKRTKKTLFLKTARLLGWFKGITWHASTSQEKNEIERHFGKNSTVKIAENLGQVSVGLKRCQKKSTDQLKMIFVSRISTKKNLLFVLKCMNSDELKTKTSLTVVGPMEDENYGNECKDYSEINQLNVQFLGGKTPDELKDLYTQHDLFILPTHHENYGHVIIEALSFGTPVLISENTPWRNLKKKGIGADLPLSLDLFRNQIKDFLSMSDDEWGHYSNSAHKFASEQINSQTAIDANTNLFLSCQQ